MPRLRLSLIACLMFCAGANLSAQDADRAAKIYADTSKSIVLLLAKSATGEIVGQGTGFLVSGRRIVTNEHVVRAGSLVIDLGAVKVPAVVERIDTRNDLAILSTTAELAATPLILASKLPDPGTSIFAIGNPEGLERSISTGVVAGIREFEGRQLIQVTAPISHGSSGGPIMDSRGEVIGVAVGILEAGQNLNFAVPASFVKELLIGNVQADPDFSLLIKQFDEVVERRANETYSSDANSAWQKDDREADLILEKAAEKSGDSLELVLKVISKAQDQNVDLAVSTSERAVRIKSTVETNMALGHSLASKAIGSSAQEADSVRERAEKAFRLANELSKFPTFEVVYSLADVIEDRNPNLEAESLFRKSLELSRTAGSSTQQAQSLRSLARIAYTLKRPDQGDAWFKALVNLGKATAFDWQLQAQRLDSVNNFQQAGYSFIEAAKNGASWTNWCEAAGSLASVAGETDSVLSSARKCVAEGSGKQNSETRLGSAHYLIAAALNDRGVFQEALSQAKEASVLIPTDSWAYNAQAEALIGLRRFQEAINASTQAIRLSDGKYSTMHFNLGQPILTLKIGSSLAKAIRKPRNSILKTLRRRTTWRSASSS